MFLRAKLLDSQQPLCIAKVAEVQDCGMGRRVQLKRGGIPVTVVSNASSTLNSFLIRARQD